MRVTDHRQSPGERPGRAHLPGGGVGAPRALAFPRADGPALPDLIGAARIGAANAPAGAAPGTPGAAPTQPAMAGVVPGHPGTSARASQRRSIAMVVTGVLVLVIGWSMGIGYVVSTRGVEAAFRRDEVDRIELAAQVAENSLQQEAGNVVAVARALRSDPQLQRVLGNPAERATYLAGVRAQAGVDSIEVVGAPGAGGMPGVGGVTPGRAADRGALDGAAGEEEPLSVAGEADGLVLGIRGALLREDDSVAAVVAVRRKVDRAWLRESVGRAGVDLALVDPAEVVVSTDPRGAAGLDRAAIARALADGRPVPFAVPGEYGAIARPVRLGEHLLAVVSFVPVTVHPGGVGRARRQWASIAALTLAGAALLGWLLTRRLIRPIQDLTLRAEQLAVRFAGRPVARRGTELQALVASFEAMTTALLGHAERLQHAHMSELQNSLELQRQYALMRLLRSLAAAGNESQAIEDTLGRALQEIGEYLDWPVGRVLLPPAGQAGIAGPSRSIWFVRDPHRFEAFIAASNGGSIDRDPTQFVGRAFVSGLPHWVSDLTRLTGWNRRAAALACGLRSGLVIPVIADGQYCAFIEFFTDHRVDATAEMLELIDAINAELWRVAERHRVERELRAGAAMAPVGTSAPDRAARGDAPQPGVQPAADGNGFQFELPQAGGKASAPALDLDAIERIRDMERRGAANLLERLVQTYLVTAARLLDDADAAFGRDDIAAVRQVAHTLKSSSASLGAAALGHTCASIEARARDGQLEGARALWRGARGEFERVSAALRALLAMPAAA